MQPLPYHISCRSLLTSALQASASSQAACLSFRPAQAGRSSNIYWLCKRSLLLAPSSPGWTNTAASSSRTRSPLSRLRKHIWQPRPGRQETLCVRQDQRKHLPCIYYAPRWNQQVSRSKPANLMRAWEFPCTFVTLNIINNKKSENGLAEKVCWHAGTLVSLVSTQIPQSDISHSSAKD